MQPPRNTGARIVYVRVYTRNGRICYGMPWETEAWAMFFERPVAGWVQSGWHTYIR